MTQQPIIHGGGILGESIRVKRRELDVFDLPQSTTTVEYVSDEVTSTCPMTAQPDWYVVRITLDEAKLGLESKALKLYLQSFRDDGQFCEQFADTIASDVRDATGAAVTVEVEQKPRGGISIRAVARVA